MCQIFLSIISCIPIGTQMAGEKRCASGSSLTHPAEVFSVARQRRGGPSANLQSCVSQELRYMATMAFPKELFLMPTRHTDVKLSGPSGTPWDLIADCYPTRSTSLRHGSAYLAKASYRTSSLALAPILH